MTALIFSDYRQPAAAEAYAIAYDYLARAGAIDEEFEVCVFLAQSLTEMVEQGQTNKIRMANKAIADYQRHAACRSATMTEEKAHYR